MVFNNMLGYGVRYVLNCILRFNIADLTGFINNDFYDRIFGRLLYLKFYFLFLFLDFINNFIFMYLFEKNTVK